MTRHRWTRDEDAAVAAVYANRTGRRLPELAAVAARLGVTKAQCRDHARIKRYVRAGRQTKWTAERDDIVRTLYGVAATGRIAALLDTTPDAVRLRAAMLGVEGQANRDARVTQLLAECDRLRVLLAYRVSLISVVEAATALGVTTAELIRAGVTEAVAGQRLAVGDDTPQRSHGRFARRSV